MICGDYAPMFSSCLSERSVVSTSRFCFRFALITEINPRVSVSAWLSESRRASAFANTLAGLSARDRVDVGRFVFRMGIVVLLCGDGFGGSDGDSMRVSFASEVIAPSFPSNAQMYERRSSRQNAGASAVRR